MKRLSSEQTLELAEAALGPDLAGQYRLPLHSLSRDIPLLAVLAAELLKRGELAEKALTDTDEFRTHVFEGLLPEARAVEDRFGATRTRGSALLTCRALCSRQDGHRVPQACRRTSHRRERSRTMLATFFPRSMTRDRRNLTGAGIRVSPDLLSGSPRLHRVLRQARSQHSVR